MINLARKDFAKHHECGKWQNQFKNWILLLLLYISSSCFTGFSYLLDLKYIISIPISINVSPIHLALTPISHARLHSLFHLQNNTNGSILVAFAAKLSSQLKFLHNQPLSRWYFWELTLLALVSCFKTNQSVGS
jgi:hypothetical protein